MLMIVKIVTICTFSVSDRVLNPYMGKITAWAYTETMNPTAMLVATSTRLASLLWLTCVPLVDLGHDLGDQVGVGVVDVT